MDSFKADEFMRVLHSGTLAAKAGGPAMSTYLTLYGLQKLGIEAELIQFPLSEGDVLRGDRVAVHYAESPWEYKLGFAPRFENDILRLGIYDIYHAQGIWQWQTYALVNAARHMKKPYVITPRGMLYPQDIAKSSTLLKQISLRLRLLSDLNHAACVHVTCLEEMKYCRDLGVTVPCCVIPNPVEIKDYLFVKQDEVFRLGYLGRLSPRKNVEALIYAFASLRNEMKNAELLIIGGGDEMYEKFLKSEAKRLNLNNVFFTGFLSGEKKEQALASCSVLAMPSEFENLGNVILEGLVRRIPCIATKGSPWEELNTKQCGWWVDFSQEAITEAVKNAICTSSEQLSTMGNNGRKLMEEYYSVEAVALKMKEVYSWILNVGSRPDCVHVI